MLAHAKLSSNKNEVDGRLTKDALYANMVSTYMDIANAAKVTRIDAF